MTPTDLAKEALKLADGVTPGPWKLWAMDVLWDKGGDSDLDKAVPVCRTYFQDSQGKPRTFDASFIAFSRTALPALAKAYLELEERCRLAEGVCELAKDAQHSLEHYEWCDRVKAMKIRREIPPGECDCGVLAFKCAVAAWRSHVTAKKEGGG